MIRKIVEAVLGLMLMAALWAIGMMAFTFTMLCWYAAFKFVSEFVLELLSL